MNAGTLRIHTIFGQDRRYLVPLFQRPYVWKRETQWEPLWEDVRAVADRLSLGQTVRPHFLGAIVLDQELKPTGHLETRLVIDGQQRLTTIQLLLEAFADYCANAGADRHHKAVMLLTRNNDPLSDDPDDRFKVWPTNVDREHFRKVMNACSPSELLALYEQGDGDTGNGIADAYLYFYSALTEWLEDGERDRQASIEAIYTTIREYIRVVVIDLGSEDDAQLIFETLNARGTPLLPTDLVKNFIFHEAMVRKLPVDALYRRYWRPFDEEQGYWREEIVRGRVRQSRIDVFLQHYLALHTGEDILSAHLYKAFQDFASASGQGPTEWLESLARYGAVYQAFDTMPKDAPEGMFFHRLGELETTTAYPFLLELFEKHGAQPTEIRAVLKDVESFLVRRLVCGLTTKGYNRLFIDLAKAIRSAEGQSPADVVRGFLLSGDGDSTRWPRDREFRAAWLESPLYRRLVRRRVRMLLEALECDLRTGMSEKIAIDSGLTVEHLMPQEWRQYWPLPQEGEREQLVSERETLLHTLGNLTLVTGKLNPSLSNAGWDKKRKSLLRHSVLKLNAVLVEMPEWTESDIRDRGRRTFAAAKKMWPIPAAAEAGAAD